MPYRWRVDAHRNDLLFPDDLHFYQAIGYNFGPYAIVNFCPYRDFAHDDVVRLSVIV